MAALWRKGTRLTMFQSHGTPVYRWCMVVSEGFSQFLTRRVRKAEEKSGESGNKKILQVKVTYEFRTFCRNIPVLCSRK